jgi:hypothetical protein
MKVGIETLKETVEWIFPEAKVKLTAPQAPLGAVWFLDVNFEKLCLVVEWEAGHDFSLTVVKEDTGYGVGADQVGLSFENVREQVIAMMLEQPRGAST